MVKRTYLILLAGLVCWTGCGEAAPGLVPVEGVVTLDGQPMPNVQITFDQPELPPRENIGYTGRTDSQGRYVLRPLGGNREGVPPGTYRVSLSTVSERPALEGEPPPPERVPPQYRQGRLTADIPPEGKKDLNFELRSR